MHGMLLLRYTHFCRRYKKWDNLLRFASPTNFPCCDDCQSYKEAFQDTHAAWLLHGSSCPTETWMEHLVFNFSLNQACRSGCVGQVWDSTAIQGTHPGSIRRSPLGTRVWGGITNHCLSWWSVSLRVDLLYVSLLAFHRQWILGWMIPPQSLFTLKLHCKKRISTCCHSFFVC